jgi:hypothetical protein
MASATMDTALLPDPALPPRSRIPATTGAPPVVAGRGGQRGQATAQHLLASDLGVPETGALLGVPEHRAQQRIDVDEHLLGNAGQQPAATDQVDQVRPCYRSQLQGMAVGELPQKLTQRRRGVHLTEQPRHPTRPDHIQIVDAVRAGGHPGDDRSQLTRRIGPGRGHLGRPDGDLARDQLRQARPLGQPHHRDQPRTRHEVRIIEQRRGHGPRMR